MHPTILDASFQTLLAAADMEDNQNHTMLPVSIQQLMFTMTPCEKCYCFGKITKSNKLDIDGDLVLFDESGNVLIKIHGFKFQAIDKTNQADQNQKNLLYKYHWSKVKQKKNSVSSFIGEERMLVFSGKNSLEVAFAAFLKQKQVPFNIVSFGDCYEEHKNGDFTIRESEENDYLKVISRCRKNDVSMILYINSLLEKTEEISEIPEKISGHLMNVTNIVKSLVKNNLSISLRIITNGVFHIVQNDKDIHLSSSSLWGMGRLISNEQPGIDVRLIDISKDVAPEEFDILLHVLESHSKYEDIAIRKNEIYTRELVSYQKEDEESKKQVVSTKEPLMLDVKSKGNIDNLHYRSIQRISPSAGEIEVEVKSFGLNYKDLFKTLGQISNNVLEDTYYGSLIGMESCGVVVSKGEGAKDINIGDWVYIWGRGFKTYNIVPEKFAISLPKNMSYLEAPVFLPFVTAYYCLVEIGRLKKGERVLIHSASGGVGLAAVEFAKWIGCEIFATAGNEEKRQYLKKIGVHHVLNSRSLKFAEDIKSLTNGKGIDVVLNAISGDALIKSLSILASFGRFIEIGKRDIAENTGLPMKYLNKNITFSAVDLDLLMNEKPSLLVTMFQEVRNLFESGEISPIPITVFEARKAVDAFRFMAQSSHIGKIVIDLAEKQVEMRNESVQQSLIKKDGTYLITGGTSGFGLEIAKWLSRKGAGTLVLISRRGVLGICPEDIDCLQKHGTQVKVLSADISDEIQVKNLISRINIEMMPIKGIFHGAMVLDDEFIVDMNETRYRKVMGPKILGALNLHKHTENLKLDFFVSFSSISTILGNQGQGNYIAANTFLDFFSIKRRLAGLPAITINLGAISNVGIAVRQKGVENLLKDIGFISMTPEEILDRIEEIFSINEAQIGLFDIDWLKWSKTSPAGNSSRFEKHVGASPQEIKSRKQLIIENLINKEDMKNVIEDVLCEIFSKIVKIPVSKLQKNESILNWGVDSLMTLEIKYLIKAEIGIEVSTIDILRGLSISQMAVKMIEALKKTEVTYPQ